MEHETFTAAQLAERWNISRSAIYDKILAGYLHTIEVSRGPAGRLYLRVPLGEVLRHEAEFAKQLRLVAVANGKEG